MSERIIHLRDFEARLVAKGKLMAIVRKDKPPEDMMIQPGDSYAIYPAAKSGWIYWQPGTGEDLAEFTKKVYEHGLSSPFGSPGDVLACKETWSVTAIFRHTSDHIPKVGIGWKATGRKDKIFDVSESLLNRMESIFDSQKKIHWLSPATMPKEFIRRRFTVKTVRAMQAKDIHPSSIILETVNYDWDELYKRYRDRDAWVWLAELEEKNG